MVGDTVINRHHATTKLFEESGLEYTMLRLTWLYNEVGNTRYILTEKGEPFQGAQVTRQAVAQLVVDIIKDTSGKYINADLGVGEPDSNWDKPSFY